VAIGAVFARKIRAGSGGRGPQAGTAWTEPVESTAATRKVERRIEWHERTLPDGRIVRDGSRTFLEGDEQAYGWVLTLEGASAEPLVKVI
jgi:hypothetical protein